MFEGIESEGISKKIPKGAPGIISEETHALVSWWIVLKISWETLEEFEEFLHESLEKRKTSEENAFLWYTWKNDWRISYLNHSRTYCQHLLSIKIPDFFFIKSWNSPCIFFYVVPEGNRVGMQFILKDFLEKSYK